MSEFFADAESSYNEARFVYYGYPFDGTACFRKGSSEAPDAIRKNSYNFETYLLELGIDLSDVLANDWGNLEITKDQDKNEKLLEDLVLKIVNEGKFPIGLGGEHSLTPAAVKAAHTKYPNLAVVILDAHLDFRNEYEGNTKSHATVTKRVSEIVGVDNVRPIGIRSVSQSEITEARSVGLKFVESGWTELREYLADVIDDLETEQLEIINSKNTFLTYSHDVHVCRMAGCYSVVADLLDEEPLKIWAAICRSSMSYRPCRVSCLSLS